MKRQEQIDVLGVFPAFDARRVGGIQESARIAWAGITHDLTRRQRRATLFCFSQDADGGGHVADFSAASRRAAVAIALNHEWRSKLVLVWHVGLLKLLPFFRLADADVVLFLHGIEVWRHLDWLTRRQLHRVTLFLSNSEHTWARFLKYHPTLATRRQHTVALGLGAVGDPPPPPAEPPVALMLGRLSGSEDYKGHREIIGAWPHVRRQVPDAELWIVGDGDLRGQLEAEGRALGLEDKVRFWGYLPEEKKQELLARSRCLVLPSRCEGFGLVYLEAMRLGRPCLVSTHDAGREVVNPPDAGLAVDPDDREALAASLCRLLTDTAEWQVWSRQAVKRYESHYTARHFQARLNAALFAEIGNTAGNV
jgi:glycosyltransferase involved in cell wall biosynthesis